MPDYVYALHDFAPEHEDEVSFRAGERIEVIERDDLYGDGWWQGRNLAGKVGLFPQSYTTPAPPVEESTVASTSTLEHGHPGKPGLQTLTEESENESPVMPEIASPVPKPPPATFLNGHDTGFDSPTQDTSPEEPADGEMMKATMTDVQKAIEQLGRHRIDGDGERSFSFASTRDGGTESDFDLSDMDTQDEVDGQGEDWHKGARRKLAEKARKAVEEAQRLEEMMSNGHGERRSTAPPIDVELSDESDDEGEIADDRVDYTSSSFHRTHPHIPEEDEEDVVSSPTASSSKKRLSQQQEATSAPSTATPEVTTTLSPNPPGQQLLPALEKDETQVPTATRDTFPELQALPVIPPISIPPIEAKQDAALAPSPVLVPPPIAASVTEQAPTSVPPIETKRNSAPIPVTQPLAVLPSPTASSHASAQGLSTPFQGTSISSTAPTTAPPTEIPSDEKKESKHPSEWSVEEVVEWLRSRGFDQDVCEKFTEQEITGDVLLELDVNVLKTEIGIPAFGKRMRIANAIAELRRPPSISSFEPRQETHTPSSMVHHSTTIHQRTLSLTQSHHSFPGTPVYAQTHSGHSSMGSPIGYSVSSNGPLMPHPEVGRTDGLPTSATSASFGLGIAVPESANGKAARGRPSQLMLSPSAPSLKEKVIIEAPQVLTPDEDRAHMSDGDVVTSSTSVRRRLFGRSHDGSTLSVGSRNSKDGTSLAASTSTSGTKDVGEKDKGKDKDHARSNTVSSKHRSKRSMDAKSGDRLSIFGSTFGGTLGKGRKPAPSEDTVDSKSNSVFSRLGGSSIRKSSSQRPTTPNSPKRPSTAEKKDKTRSISGPAVAVASVASAVARPTGLEAADDKSTSTEKPSSEQRHTLRKRTSSNPAVQQATVPAGESSGVIKPGQSILEQVGEPDHTGWMRKKAVRYNTWKPRYFVLKGEHLYILRSNSKSETRLKGYINIRGYRVTVDETLDPGRYCFRIDHDQDKTHYFSSEEKTVIREWMKAIMKATIGRDYTRPVVSSCNIPTIPLAVAQTMNPAPRPPSPGARDATQKALRRENPNQLSSRDARVLMGLPNNGESSAGRQGVQTFFADDASVNGSVATPRTATAPPRPSRDLKRGNSIRSTVTTSAAEDSLIDWANSHLPEHLQVRDTIGPLFGGLGLLRIAESIKGKPASPPVPDSAFPTDPSDDKLDGLFRLFDFLLDNDVKMGSVSINDVRQGKRDKVLQLLKALRAWEDKRRALASMAGSVTAGSFMAPHYGY